jgi:photosystem II stability/assembly factor-like uncharacterized protein
MKSKSLLFSLLAILIGTTVFAGSFTGFNLPKDNGPSKFKTKPSNKSSQINMNWTSIGPDNYGGKTKAVLVDKNDPQLKTLFAGTSGDGIWKSTDKGISWSKISNSEHPLNVSCMIQAPNGEIWVGTGDHYYNTLSIDGTDKKTFTAYGGFIGHGIYRSTDGNTFTQIDSTKPAENDTTSPWAYVNKIAFAPNGKVYAATNSGLMCSSDNGLNWTMAKYKHVDTTATNYLPLNFFCTNVAVSSDGAVAVSANGKGYISDGSTDTTFVCISTYIPGDTLADSTKLPASGIGLINFAFAPSDPNYLYAVAIGDGTKAGISVGELENIYLSTDKGNSWRIIGPGGSDYFMVFGNYESAISKYSNIGNYVNSIAVFPDNKEKLLVGGTYMWEGVKANEDGNYYWQIKEAQTINHFDIVFAPNSSSTCYISSAYGILATTDGFQTYSQINRNYNSTQFYTVAFSGEGAVIGGSQDNGTIYIDGTGNTNQEGASINSGNGGYCAISAVNPDILIYSLPNCSMSRSDDKGGSVSPVFLSSTITNTNTFLTPFAMWESFNNLNSRDSVTYCAKKNIPANGTIVAKSNNQAYPFYYVTPVAIDSADSVKIQDVVSNRFFIGVKDAVWMTKEVLNFTKEPTWFKIAQISGTPTSLAYSKDANHLFVGTKDGKLYRISNLALANDAATADISNPTCIVATTQIDSAKYLNRTITSIAVDPNNDNHIILTLNAYDATDYVYESMDAIYSEYPTFTSIQNDLPQIPVYSSLMDNETSAVIIGTEYGVWNLSDNSWSPQYNGIDNLPVMMLKQQTINRPVVVDTTNSGNLVVYPGVSNLGVIYAATYGNGLFKSNSFVGINDPENPETISATNHLNINPNPASDYANLSFKLDKSTPVQINVFDLNGKLVNSIKLNMQSVGVHKIMIDCKSLNTGSYVMQLITNENTISSKFIVIK